MFFIFIGLIALGAFAGGRTTNTPRTAIPAAVTADDVSRSVQLKPRWRVASQKSKVDDSTNVFLSIDSNQPIRGRFGDVGPAELTIRCMENTTAATFRFAGHFMADIQGYGDITYRIDDRKAKTKGFVESTSNEALGLWSGGSAIPFAKELFGGTSLYVRATPYNENPVEAEFNIAGLDEAIKPLREACRW
jgi:type VI secretion system protein VasI